MPFHFPGFVWLCLKIGSFTFGGGDPTIAAFQQELVHTRGWLDPERFALLFGLARVTPGTNILAFCAGAGFRLARWKGAIAAVVAVAGPPALMVLWFTFAYEQWKANPWATAVIGATLAAAAGMMLGGSYQLLRAQWRPGARTRALAIAVAAFGLVVRLDVSPIWVLALGALAGLCWRVPEP